MTKIKTFIPVVVATVFRSPHNLQTNMKYVMKVCITQCFKVFAAYCFEITTMWTVEYGHIHQKSLTLVM